MNHNLYAILEIDANADQDTLESAYRRLALRFHPDLNHSPDANLRMQEINVAYSILRHPQKRAEYDRQFRRTAPFRHTQPASASRRPSPPPPVRPVQRPTPPHTSTAAAPAPAEQVVIFYLDDTAYAFSIPEIETVLMAKNILPQENSPRFVEGILEVRRSFVPVIDLCRHIGVPSRRGADARVILANFHGERLGLLVDSVENYVVVPTGAIKLPRSLGSMDVPFIRGFARVGFQVVILLNLAGLLSSEQEEILLKYCQTLHSLSPYVHAR